MRCPMPTDKNVAIKDYFCDGVKTCSQWGWCQGTANGWCYGARIKTIFYTYDESKTNNRCPLPTDSNAAAKDYYCDGMRTCL